jgi:SOS-response transcriptional repressor LexA
MDPLGAKLRRQRRRLGLTLDQLAARVDVSKPYLSLIENGRVTNPPSDEKLRQLEQALAFSPGELVSHAHLQRTPSDVRAVLQRLMGEGAGKMRSADPGAQPNVHIGIDLDNAYLSGVLQQMVERASPNVEAVATRAVPVINRVSAGYPSDFTDLSYPPKVADEYVGCPEVNDTDAFAARVHGESMMPKYRPGDIVIFSPAADPREGDDCFVRFEDGQTTFKRIFFESDAAGERVIRLQPRNAKFPPQLVPAERISGLYRALYKYQRVDEERE